ncbi:COP9 signalosome complex subunit 8 [Talaromyces islandicus]|uniref:COP9 signalosome complex subunit 8 n=1 Tax=Talaromyces islandicus TaxID=28573 RepID=A0A0U1M9Z9_TALIS|nr:COP9 signalosome complex subunit 8 [Talaromyces islandicus]
MDLPSLSLDQLGKVVTESPSYEALYDVLSQYEDEACLQFSQIQVTGDEKLLSAFYSSFLISHLFTDQIEEARALTHRMPPTLVKTDKVLQNSIAVLRAVSQNKYHETYQSLRSQTWPEPVNTLVHKYDAFFTEKALKDVSQVYESIRPEAAAEYLGLEEMAQKGTAGGSSSQLVQALLGRGWEWDNETQLFRPHVPTQLVNASNGLNSNTIHHIVGLAGNHGS